MVSASSLSQELATSQEEITRISRRIQQEALTQFQSWRQNEYEMLKTQETTAADREAQVKLAEWKIGAEAGFRADAVQRSRAVIVGKVTEHLVPYSPEFSYNPKDARFVGSPVDFIVFDGLDDGAVGQVVFVEVKTGSSSLSKRERQVRDAVLAKKVAWLEMRVDLPEEHAALGEAAPPASAVPPASDGNELCVCGNCGAQNRVPREHLGRTIRCGSCRGDLDSLKNDLR